MDYERYSYSNNQYPNDYDKSTTNDGLNNYGESTVYHERSNYYTRSTEPMQASIHTQGTEPVQASIQTPSTEPVQASIQTPSTEPVQASIQTPSTEPVQASTHTQGTEPVQASIHTQGTEPVQASTHTQGTEPVQASTQTQSMESTHATGVYRSAESYSRAAYTAQGPTGGVVDGTYRMANASRIDRSYIPVEPVKKQNEKKSGSLWKKILAGMAVGIFFGLSAGVAFYFVNVLTGVTNLTQYEAAVTDDISKYDAVTNNNVTETPVTQSGIDTTSTQTITTVVTDVTEVVENVMPAVVSITNIYTETTSFWGQNFSSEAQSSGSGIIVNENESELLIVTNYHVVADADTLKVQFINESVADAHVKGTDSNMDLAVIAVELDTLDSATKDAISLAKLGDSDALKVGEPAIAIGNALGYGQSVTTGVISALDRQIEMSEDGSMTGNLIQTDAAINPGNSGGALLNVKGEVIGINSNKIGGSAIEGMGYAIPISSAEPIIENLMLRETKNKVSAEKKGYLGISGINVTSDVANMYGMPQGVYVTQVYDGTAAEAAGILNGDIIVGFEGSGVGSMEDLQGYLEYYEIGESANVTIMRAMNGQYQEMTLTVVLGKATQTQPRSKR